MTWFDDYLKRRRADMVYWHIPQMKHVLDIGCWDGYLMKRLADGDQKSVTGIDPLTENRKVEKMTFKKYTWRGGTLPFKKGSFGVVTMLAVLEHLRHRGKLVKEIRRVLTKHGKVVMTVPSPKADRLLDKLACFKMIDEKEFIEQHDVPKHEQILYWFFKEGFFLVEHKKFQLGYNNLYVFQKR